MELAGHRIERLRRLTRLVRAHGGGGGILLGLLARLHIGQIGEWVERGRNRFAAVHKGEDILLELGGRGIAVLTILGHGLGADGIPHLRQTGHHGARRRRHLGHMLVGDGDRGITGERRLAGQHLIQHATRGIQVGTHVHGLAAGLLGGEVLRGSHHALRLGHGGDGIIQRAGDAEIHHLHGTLIGDHDVRGLDIAVDHTHAVRILQRAQHAQHHLRGVALRQRAVHMDDVTQGLTLHILHHQVRQPFGLAVLVGDYLLAGIVDVHDIRVVHLGDGMRFTAEARQEDLIVRQIGAHNLNGDRAAETGVKADMHFGHASASDELTDLVAAVGQRRGHVAHCCSFQ